MVTVDKNTVNDLLYLNFLHDYHQTADKVEVFRKKYNSSFPEFEKRILNMKQEDTDMWDDYMEWKGFYNSLKELEKKKSDFLNGNIRIA
jgi:hypothetical protein